MRSALVPVENLTKAPLKSRSRPADPLNVKCQRVIIEAGEGTFTLDLHPRLTVIAGLGRLERESLIGEIIGALGGSRTGVHLELRDDSGRHLAVFRPKGGRHRVVDVNAAVDVSHEFVGAGGQIDLLSRVGLDLGTARKQLRVGAADLAAVEHGDEYVQALAALDQRLLWSTAERVVSTERSLGAEAEAVGSVPEQAEVVDRVEQRHQRFEAAILREERTRRHAIALGAISAAGAVPVALISPTLSLPMLAITMVAMLYSLVTRRGIGRAYKAEQDALAEAGAQSYLGFHLERVNAMLSSAESRKRLVLAAEEHRKARETWRELAGNIDVEWALDHREEVIAAALLQRGASPLNGSEPAFAPIEGELAANLAHTLVTRMAEARRLGPGGESLPLILDDPFIELEQSVKPALLELLSRSAGHPQVIFLTEDRDVASWARLEALTGEVSIVEAAPEPAPAPAPQPTIDLSNPARG